MSKRNVSPRLALNLKAGELVEVRSSLEILATLDQRGRLDNMPFMPEMLQYCGQKLRVYKRADKTCQYVVGWSIRRVQDSVLLEGARCDGTGHGGCEAGCLIFWKEAWLKRVDGNDWVPAEKLGRASTRAKLGIEPCTFENVFTASRSGDAGGETTYSCQATDVYEFSSHMRMWDPRQYIRDLRSGNLSTGLSGDSRVQRVLETILGIMRVLNAIVISFFNEVQGRRDRPLYPFVKGTLNHTPIERLDLQPGDLVRVRSKEEILATLDKGNRNRGLLFDSEMLAYCGGTYRVVRRVYRIVDEKTGRMLNMKYPCIVLEGVACRSDYHRLCPRAIYHYWRESWLMPAVDAPFTTSIDRVAEACEQC